MGTVFEIQKFSVNDGPGIRTTVFLKGCPLRCQWCHNPESNSASPEILFFAAKCIGCGACMAVCQNSCHSFAGKNHLYRREGCVGCGACADACVTETLSLAGKAMTAGEVVEEVMKDAVFYRDSGGITLSGGEPLLQIDFAEEILKLSKRKGLHTAVETCGYVPFENLKRVLPVTDLFLYDYKLTDDSLHKHYTGVSNQRILENLRRLDRVGGHIILRCPVIPTVNDNEAHFRAIASLADSLSHVLEIHVEPYHPLGKSKSEALHIPYAFSELSFPSSDTVRGWIAAIQQKTAIPVRQG